MLHVTHASAVTRPFRLVRETFSTQIGVRLRKERGKDPSFFPSFKPRRRTLVCYSRKMQHSPSTIYIVIPSDTFIALHLAKPSFLHGETPLVTDNTQRTSASLHQKPQEPQESPRTKNHRQEPKFIRNIKNHGRVISYEYSAKRRYPAPSSANPCVGKGSLQPTTFSK